MFSVGDRVEGVTRDKDNGAHGTVTAIYEDGYTVLLDKHVSVVGNGPSSWFGFNEVKAEGA